MKLCLTLAPLLLLGVASAEETVLWRAGEGGVHTYRIPALAETRQGTLIAVADARFDSADDLPGRIALVIRRSTDAGRTWSPSRILRQVKTGGVGDASLLADPRTGRVWCFHAYGPPGAGFQTGGLQLHAITSDDDGRTWSEPRDLTPQIARPEWKAFFATSGTHFSLPSGRYLVPLVVKDASGVVAARNAYSDDGGRTWRTSPVVAPGTDESHAVGLADGTVYQNLRAQGRRIVARSHDGGVRFDAATRDEALPEPSCNAGLAVFMEGATQWMLFTNPASSKRENLTLRLSRDGGRSWPRSRVVHPGPSAYSTVLGLRDGNIAILYERGDNFQYESIYFMRIPFNLIVPGPKGDPEE